MAESNIVRLRDVNDQAVFVEFEELTREFITGGLTVYGMDLSAIAELRHEYLKRNGRIPITTKSIKEVFSE